MSEVEHSIWVTCMVVWAVPWEMVIIAVRVLPVLFGVAVAVTVVVAPEPAPVVGDRVNQDWFELAVQELLFAL